MMLDGCCCPGSGSGSGSGDGDGGSGSGSGSGSGGIGCECFPDENPVPDGVTAFGVTIDWPDAFSDQNTNTYVSNNSVDLWPEYSWGNNDHQNDFDDLFLPTEARVALRCSPELSFYVYIPFYEVLLGYNVSFGPPENFTGSNLTIESFNCDPFELVFRGTFPPCVPLGPVVCGGDVVITITRIPYP